jgi:hypothetical protein
VVIVHAAGSRLTRPVFTRPCDVMAPRSHPVNIYPSPVMELPRLVCQMAEKERSQSGDVGPGAYIANQVWVPKVSTVDGRG